MDVGADQQGVKHTGIRNLLELSGNTLFRMEQRGIGLFKRPLKLRGWVVDRVRAGQTECEKPAPDLSQDARASHPA